MTAKAAVGINWKRGMDRVLLTAKLSLFVFGCRQEVKHGLVLVGSLFSKLHFLETFPPLG